MDFLEILAEIRQFKKEFEDAGEDYPMTLAVQKYMDNRGTTKKHAEPTKKQTSSTERVRAWRLRNKERTRALGRRAWHKFKSKKAQIEH